MYIRFSKKTTLGLCSISVETSLAREHEKDLESTKKRYYNSIESQLDLRYLSSKKD